MCKLEKEAAISLSRSYMNMIHTLMETLSVTMKIDETDLSRQVIMQCGLNIYSAAEALYLKLHDIYINDQDGKEDQTHEQGT